jgi:hypothetical protein
MNGGDPQDYTVIRREAGYDENGNDHDNNNTNINYHHYVSHDIFRSMVVQVYDDVSIEMMIQSASMTSISISINDNISINDQHQ